MKSWNQYSDCMHVSIFLCFRVSVLKSLNYACKNLTYAYICMKVYSLAGQRETNITVSKADGSGKIWSLTGWSPGSLWQLIGLHGQIWDLWMRLLLLSTSVCISLSVRFSPFVSLQAHSSEPGSCLPMVLKSILPPRAFFFHPFLLPSQLEECCWHLVGTGLGC